MRTANSEALVADPRDGPERCSCIDAEAVFEVDSSSQPSPVRNDGIDEPIGTEELIGAADSAIMLAEESLDD